MKTKGAVVMTEDGDSWRRFVATGYSPYSNKLPGEER